MRRILLIVLVTLLQSTAVHADPCVSETKGSQALGNTEIRSFDRYLLDMKQSDIVERFCALTPDKKAFAEGIYLSASKDLSADKQVYLFRMSVMMVDIETNLEWAAANGAIRMDDDGYVSIGATRFAKSICKRFPQTSLVLDEAYFQKLKSNYAAALKLIQKKEKQADRMVLDAQSEIRHMEARILELKDKIAGLREDSRAQKELRHTLELYKP